MTLFEPPAGGFVLWTKMQPLLAPAASGRSAWQPLVDPRGSARSLGYRAAKVRKQTLPLATQ